MGGPRRGAAPRVRTGPAMKFRPPLETGRGAATGTRPLAEAATVSHVLGMMVVQAARRALFAATVAQRAAAYIVASLVVSVVGDFMPVSDSYMATEDNVLMVYVVHHAWSWTCLAVGLFVAATSHVYSAGQMPVVRKQLTRVVVATAACFGVAGVFILVEEVAGVCLRMGGPEKGSLSRSECIRRGLHWKGFSASVDMFVLVWSCLFMVEEARAYLGWERIKDFIARDHHRRMALDAVEARERPMNALSKLSCSEFVHVMSSYRAVTPLVRVLFCILAVVVVIADVMIVANALYFSNVAEKVVASCSAVLLWFFLYRVVYIQPWSPGLPGAGPFKYIRAYDTKQKTNNRDQTSSSSSQSTKWSSKQEVPKFMGMPLYGLSGQNNSNNPAASGVKRSEEAASAVSEDAVQRPLDARKRSTSRSSSRSALNAGSKNRLNVPY